ncbi:MAG: hypothetical protein IJZ86_10025 [Bacteroides sp.]|nr:hypothetical protein [Bacteroides sp.]
MRNKRYIAYILFVISMVMPIIPVIPHHHHADGRLCMRNDITTDCCSGHHHGGESDHCCDNSCVAIHFFEQTPNSDESWTYDFTPWEVILFLDYVPLLLSLPESIPHQPDTCYRETLHGTCITRATGLRAPPSVIA